MVPMAKWPSTSPDHLEVGAAGQHQGRGSVAEVVETDAREACGREDGLEALLVTVPGVGLAGHLASGDV
jgi:hypothetical protein